MDFAKIMKDEINRKRKKLDSDLKVNKDNKKAWVLTDITDFVRDRFPVIRRPDRLLRSLIITLVNQLVLVRTSDPEYLARLR